MTQQRLRAQQEYLSEYLKNLKTVIAELKFLHQIFNPEMEIESGSTHSEKILYNSLVRTFEDIGAARDEMREFDASIAYKNILRGVKTAVQITDADLADDEFVQILEVTLADQQPGLLKLSGKFQEYGKDFEAELERVIQVGKNIEAIIDSPNLHVALCYAHGMASSLVNAFEEYPDALQFPDWQAILELKAVIAEGVPNVTQLPITVGN